MESGKVPLTDENRASLLEVAAASIESRLKNARFLQVDPVQYPEPLQFSGASFVTLKIKDSLRGCIGSLEATRPLVLDVAHNAHQAAFGDPRFSPLTRTESDQTDIEISILSHPQPIHFTSETDLVQRLRPGIDGLILEEGSRRGTFLPSLWEVIQDPRRFLRELKQKTGLPPDYWSAHIRVMRYTTESFHQERFLKDSWSGRGSSAE